MARARSVKRTLLVKVRLHGGDFGSADEQALLGHVEQSIEAGLEGDPDAGLDGNEIGDGTWTLVILGRELERARTMAASSLAEAGIAASDIEFIEPPRPKRVLVGSIIAIPVDGKFVYIQYIGQDPPREMGDMVIVFDQTTKEPRPLVDLRLDGRLFGPVFAAIRWPVAQGEWTVVGRRPPPDEPFPGFQYRALFRRDIGQWMIWDGRTHVRVQSRTEAQARLEVRTTYLPLGLVGRISEELKRRAAGT